MALAILQQVVQKHHAAHILGIEIVVGIMISFGVLYVQGDLSQVQWRQIIVSDRFVWLLISAIAYCVVVNWGTIKILQHTDQKHVAVIAPLTTFLTCCITLLEKRNVDWISAWLGISIAFIGMLIYFAYLGRQLKHMLIKLLLLIITGAICNAISIVVLIETATYFDLSSNALFAIRYTAVLPVAFASFMFQTKALVYTWNKRHILLLAVVLLLQIVVANYMWYQLHMILGIVWAQIAICMFPFFTLLIDKFVHKKSIDYHYLGAVISVILGIVLMML